MPSFDIVSKVDLQEVDNAINQAKKEMLQRYDFKGSKSQINLDKLKKTIEVIGDDDYKLKAVDDMLQSKLVKRGVSLKALEHGTPQSAMNGLVKKEIKLQQGIPTEKAKELIKTIKESGLKVQSQIQDDQVRITGKKKDDLQEVMTLVRSKDFSFDVQFDNFRD